MIIEIIKHTPIWVFILFLVLLGAGIQQSRQREVKKWILWLLPAGMVCLSYFGVSSGFGDNVLLSLFWVIGLGTCIALFGFVWPIGAATFLSERNKFLVEGSWLPLLLMMAIFFIKYAVAVSKSLAIPVVATKEFAYVCVVVYGALSGVFVARALSILRASSSERQELTPAKD